MNFKDLKIGTKLMTGFGLVAIITLIVGIVGYMGLERVSRSFHEVSDVRMPSVQYLLEIELGLEELTIAHRTLLNPNLSAEAKARQFRNMAQSRERYRKAIELYTPLNQTDEEAALWKQFLERMQVWRNHNLEFERLIDELGKIDIFYPMQFLKDLETFQGDHYLLQVNLASTIRSGRTFDGGDDHTACRLGRWLPTVNSQNPIIIRAFRDLNEPHRQFHRAVHEIKSLVNAGNRNEAWRIYETVLLPSAQGVFANFEIAINEVIRAVEIFEQAEKINIQDAVVNRHETMALLGQIIELNLTLANAEIATGDQAVSTSEAMVIGGILIGLALAIALGLIITRMISAPLIKGVGFAQAIAEGNLTAELENEIITRKDEVGQLGNALQNMVNKLKEVISSVVTGSDNIASASQQMSSTAQEMSQGGTEQASSAEEVSSSMEEMAANIQQNTDNARETEKIAKNVSEGISKVGSAAAESLESIRNIASKINIIGEISRQTNILALNAAVEAARAGEHGRGFAVVAAEVRKLAENSRVAADEINKLANNSVKVTENAGSLMQTLIPEINKTASLVQEIAAASIEQNAGADQINSAIQQLNQITQQNAAASEEMATSSEELATQADQLLELVSYFKLDQHQMKANTKAKKITHVINHTTKPQTHIVKTSSNGKTNYTNGLKLNMDSSANDNQFEHF